MEGRCWCSYMLFVFLLCLFAMFFCLNTQPTTVVLAKISDHPCGALRRPANGPSRANVFDSVPFTKKRLLIQRRAANHGQSWYSLGEWHIFHSSGTLMAKQVQFRFRRRPSDFWPLTLSNENQDTKTGADKGWTLIVNWSELHIACCGKTYL